MPRKEAQVSEKYSLNKYSSYEHVGQVVMPRPVFTAVPTLPMFLVEPGRKPGNILTSQTDEASSSHILSVSDITTGVAETDFVKRPRRRPGRRRYGSNSKSRDRQSSNGEVEVLVHSSHKHHHHHRHKSRHRTRSSNEEVEEEEKHQTMEEDVPQETKDDGEASSSDILDTCSQAEVEGTTNTEPSPVNPEGCELLLREVKRLREVNQDLSRKLQASQSSLDSGYQQTVTEDIIRKKEEQIVSLHSNLIQLDEHHQNLEKQRDMLKSQLDEIKTRQATQQHLSNAEYEKIAHLESQNQELTEDVTMLKNLVYRLNVELENYQERFRKLGKSDSSPPKSSVSNRTLPGKDGALAWNKINKETLIPLLDAYSETIKEKDELIQDFQRNSKKSVARCKELVEENERLYRDLEEAKQKTAATDEEWKVLQQDSTLAREQNELLTKQLQVQKEKLQEVHSAYQQRGTSLAKDLEEVCNKYHQCRGESLTLQGRYTVLREEYDKLRNDWDNRVPFSVHSASVTECRRLFEELKLKYDSDKTSLTNKVHELQIVKPQLEIQVATVISENQQLQVQVSSLEKLLKKSQLKSEELQGRVVTTQVSRDTTKRQLHKAMAFAEELVAEQENLLRQLHAKQEETKSIAKLGTTIVCRMGSLKSKLKNVQQGAWQELEVIEKRIRQQESGVERMKEEYHEEVQRLRNLVRQKETIIGHLQKEKSKTEENLEVVWRAATSEDIHIKESLRHVNFRREKETVHFLNDSDT